MENSMNRVSSFVALEQGRPRSVDEAAVLLVSLMVSGGGTRYRVSSSRVREAIRSGSGRVTPQRLMQLSAACEEYGWALVQSNDTGGWVAFSIGALGGAASLQGDLSGRNFDFDAARRRLVEGGGTAFMTDGQAARSAAAD